MYKKQMYKFEHISTAISYMDGWLDCLKQLGKVDQQSEYAVSFIKMNEDDIRVVFINIETKQDFIDIPICIVPHNEQTLDELGQYHELEASRSTTN